MRNRGLGLLIPALAVLSACGDPPETTTGAGTTDAPLIESHAPAAAPAAAPAPEALEGREPAESTPPAPEEEEFRIPHDWCGTGRVDVPLLEDGRYVVDEDGRIVRYVVDEDGKIVLPDEPRKLGPRPPRGKDGAWSLTGNDRVWSRRALRQKPDGHWAWGTEYARLEDGTWRYWGEAEERRRLSREAKAAAAAGDASSGK